jgi:hypothetical protein
MSSIRRKNGFGGKNVLFDQSSPEQSDHLNLLIVNRLKWVTEIGGEWSITTACPHMSVECG